MQEQKELFFVANWKSHKTTEETIAWLKEFNDLRNSISLESKTIVICPPFTALSKAHEYITSLRIPVHLGAQNVSPFDDGAYTGEVSARQIREFAEYVIIGHSERNRYFSEKSSDVEQKIKVSQKESLKIILCIADENAYSGQIADFVVYEPPSAISTFEGKVEDPTHIEKVFETFAQKTQAKLLYGGSVNPITIPHFTSIPLIHGFLVGAASLDPKEFIKLLTSC